jgi:hypothetical protein
MTAKKATKEQNAAEIDPRFAPVVKAFAKDRAVSRESRKGFGSGALKVHGKIFAMMSSRSKFVVKLPKGRVDELVAAGLGERFDPGHGRAMKEWIVVESGKANWVALAKEARQFVKQTLRLQGRATRS